MKFEKIDGVQYLVLEKNDKICITTPDELEQKQINIKSDDEGLEISGNSSIVSSIRGEGMLDKVYIPPVISSDEIIEKCDKWLDMFKQVHDTFKKLALTDEYREQHVVMELSFPTFFSFADNVKGRCIVLDLVQYGTTLKEGVTISVDDANDDIYAYLAASALDYYVSQNLGDKKIDLLDFNGILYSNKKKEGWTSVPMLASVCSLTSDSPEYYKMVYSIIGNHNIGESSEQLIANLKNRIYNQQIGDRIDRDINHSTKQCEYILKKSLNSKK